MLQACDVSSISQVSSKLKKPGGNPLRNNVEVTNKTKKMELSEINAGLRRRICQYRLSKTNEKDLSTHVNAVDIVVSLVDLGLKEGRPISKEEENWFRAGLYLAYVFENSGWEDIYLEFSKIVLKVEKINYFRK